jgi:hypothetical protein
MNRLARLMVRLYPSRWRARYGLELNALIEDSGAKRLDLLDLLAGAFKMQFCNWKFPAGLALAGLAIATLAVEFVPKSYLAETSVHLAANNQGKAVQKALSRSALFEVIRAEGLYEQERARLPLEDIVEKLRKSTDIPAATPDGITKVSFQYPDEAVAQRVVLRLAAAIAEPGPVSTSLNFPNTRTFQIAGAGLGLLVGLSFVFFRRRPA